MEDMIVFVRRAEAPSAEQVAAAGRELQDALAEGERVHVEAGVDLGDPFPPGELAYVESVLGAYRIDVIAYGGTRAAALALERLYRDVPALVDPDSDALLPVPELLELLRARAGDFSFAVWADPARRDA